MGYYLVQKRIFGSFSITSQMRSFFSFGRRRKMIIMPWLGHLSLSVVYENPHKNRKSFQNAKYKSKKYIKKQNKKCIMSVNIINVVLKLATFGHFQIRYFGPHRIPTIYY